MYGLIFFVEDFFNDESFGDSFEGFNLILVEVSIGFLYIVDGICKIDGNNVIFF